MEGQSRVTGVRGVLSQPGGRAIGPCGRGRAGELAAGSKESRVRVAVLEEA